LGGVLEEAWCSATGTDRKLVLGAAAEQWHTAARAPLPPGVVVKMDLCPFKGVFAMRLDGTERTVNTSKH